MPVCSPIERVLSGQGPFREISIGANAQRAMRPLDRYWLKVSMTISVVVLVLLVAIIFGLAKDIGHLFDSLADLFS